MNSNFRKSTAIGILWTGISQFSTQVFRFIVIIILARLLSPEEFGIVGLAAIFIGFISTVNELGLSAAIIQRKDVDETHLSTSFWASVGTGITLFVLTVLVSPFVADFFQEDLVQPILIITAMGLIIGSFSVVHRALLEKSIKFKKITIAEVCAAFVSGIVSILLAIGGYGVWSIVFGGLAGNFISVIILWKISAWRPSLKFSFAHFKELFGFGGHVMGSRLLNYIDSNMDYLVVGKLLGTAALGYYTLAYHLITFPLHKISTIVTRVTFPAFSTIQDDNDTLRKGYLKVVRYISLITFPMLAGMFVVAPEFVVVVFGTKWAPMILPLQILCLAGALKSVGTTVSSILLSKGRADIQFKWNIFTAIVLPIAVIIGANYGIVGVAGAVTCMAVFLFLIIQKITNKLIDLSMYSYLKAIYPAIIGSITLIVGVEIYQQMMAIYNVPAIGMLVSSALIGIIVYVLVIRLSFNNLLKEMKLLIHEIRR
jgi:O-antigen/teichoic acid export membrane protein